VEIRNPRRLPADDAGRPAREDRDVSSTHAMSHADAAWLRMDRSTNLMVINSLMWFDEPPD